MPDSFVAEYALLIGLEEPFANADFMSANTRVDPDALISDNFKKSLSIFEMVSMIN